MTTDTRTSVMLVDDHSIMRDLLRDALENTGEFQVVGRSVPNCELFAGRFSYSLSAPFHGRAFEYHRVGLSKRRIFLRRSSSSLARIFFV